MKVEKFNQDGMGDVEHVGKGFEIACQGGEDNGTGHVRLGMQRVGMVKAITEE